MMKTLVVLIRWNLRQVRWINLLMLSCTVLYTLFSNNVISFVQRPVEMLAILIHSGLLVLWLGRSEPTGSGYLYTQGFSRDQLWWAAYLTTLISGLAMCVVYWLLDVSGLRSSLQSALGNPWFPAAGSAEANTSLWFAATYLLVLPPLHYVWIRARLAQPDSAAGWGIALCALGVYGQCYEFTNGSRAILLLAAALLSSVILVGCWIFHRQTEVQA